MTTFKLVKTNRRRLTKKEEKAIMLWWSKHPTKALHEVITHFEKKLKTTITMTRMLRVMMEHEAAS